MRKKRVHATAIVAVIAILLLQSPTSFGELNNYTNTSFPVGTKDQYEGTLWIQDHNNKEGRCIIFPQDEKKFSNPRGFDAVFPSLSGCPLITATGKKTPLNTRFNQEDYDAIQNEIQSILYNEEALKLYVNSHNIQIVWIDTKRTNQKIVDIMPEEFEKAFENSEVTIFTKKDAAQ